LNFSFYSELESFLAIPSIAGNKEANLSAIEFIRNQLEPLGFTVSVEGQSKYGQPFMVAHRKGAGSESIVLYNHYDVEQIKEGECWHTDPFIMTEEHGRYYARGIADNKAVLLARIHVIKERLARNKNVANIVWLIQGEEEVGGGLAFDVIPQQLTGLKASLFLEETGYHRDGVPLLFYHSNEVQTDRQVQLLSSLNESLYSGKAKVECRTMTKFSSCPFITNLPKGSHYIGFGPNDYQARIHRDNESMDIALLDEYFYTFSNFLDWFDTEYRRAR